MEESSPFLLTKVTINSVNTVAILLLLLPLIHHRKSIFPKTLLSIFQFGLTGLEHAVSWFICLSYVTLTAIPHAICLTWRALLCAYLKLRYGDLGNILDPLDIIGVVDNSGAPVIITSLKVLKGPCDIGDLRRRIQATVGKKTDSGRLAFPKFYQLLEEVRGYSCWTPAEFDITHHVRFLGDLDASSESTSEKRALEMISVISRAAFSPGRSPWEILVVPKFHYDDEEVNGSQEDPKFGLVIRIHHGIADGYSLLKLLIRHSSLPGEPKVNCPIPGSPGSPRMALWKTTLVTLYLTFLSARAIFVQLLARDENPLFGRGLSGETILVWSKPISLEFLKGVKRKNGVGLSTTLLTAMALSVHKYILEEFKTVPKLLSAVLPFPAPNHPDDKMANKFSVVRIPLPIAPEGHPYKSLRLIENESRKLSTAPDGPMNLFLQRLLGVYPNFFVRTFLKNRQSTLVVSNLPGTSERISIWGKPLSDSMFWIPPLGNSGISASFLSYKTHFRLGLTVDTGVVRDGQVGAQRLVDGFIEVILDFAKAAKIPLDEAFLQLSSSTSSSTSARNSESGDESEAEGSSGHYSLTSSEADFGGISDGDAKSVQNPTTLTLEGRRSLNPVSNQDRRNFRKRATTASVAETDE